MAATTLEKPPVYDQTPFPTPYGHNPPKAWFTELIETFKPGQSAVITSEGRFNAWSHEYGRSHNGYTATGEVWKPPEGSLSNFRLFQQGSVTTSDGYEIPVGVIPLWGGHANLDATVDEAMAHYAHPERVRVVAAAVDVPGVGVAVAGSIIPGTTHDEAAMMKRVLLSGDWRWIPELGGMDYLGPCFVARGALPIGLEKAAETLSRQADVDEAFYEITQKYATSVAADGRIVTAIGQPDKIGPTAFLASAAIPDKGKTMTAAEPMALYLAPAPAPAANPPSANPYNHTAIAAAAAPSEPTQQGAVEAVKTRVDDLEAAVMVLTEQLTQVMGSLDSAEEIAVETPDPS